MIEITESIFGIIGLLAITAGVLLQNRKKKNSLFILGGFFLLVYSLYLGDWIFVILQIVFILAASYKLISLIRK